MRATSRRRAGRAPGHRGRALRRGSPSPSPPASFPSTAGRSRDESHSSVPNSVGIGCAARSRTTGLTSTSSSDSTSVRMMLRRSATSASASFARSRRPIQRAQALRHHQRAGDALPDFDHQVTRSAAQARRGGAPRRGRTRSPMPLSFLEEHLDDIDAQAGSLGTLIRWSGKAPGAGFRTLRARGSRTGMSCATGVSRSNTAMDSPPRTARRVLAQPCLEVRNPHLLHRAYYD